MGIDKDPTKEGYDGQSSFKGTDGCLSAKKQTSEAPQGRERAEWEKMTMIGIVTMFLVFPKIYDCCGFANMPQNIFVDNLTLFLILHTPVDLQQQVHQPHLYRPF